MPKHGKQAGPNEIGYRDAPWSGLIDPATFTSWIKYDPKMRVPIKVRSRGPCPRCHHETTGEDWLWDLQGFVASPDDPQLAADIEQEIVARYEEGEKPPVEYINRMVCDCDLSHADGKKGCGAYWDLTVTPHQGPPAP